MSETIGTRLRRFRKACGLTQEQAAEKAGLLHNSYVRYELDKREPQYDALTKLASLYGVSVNEIVTGERDYVDEKKPAATSGLRARIIDILAELSDQDIRRVEDFVSGLKASRKG